MNQTESINSMHFGGYNALRQTMLDPSFNALNYKTLDSSFRGHSDVPPYLPLRLLPALRVLHISHNHIESFSYANILNGAPLLIEIDLSYNRIKTLDDLIELGSLKDLQKLDFSENPVSKNLLRIRIIEFLLFPKKYASHHPVKILTATYSHVPNEARVTDAPNNRPKCIEDEPPVAWELAKCRQNLYDHGRTLIKMNMKECPVPRKTRFPMLKSLNGGIISIQDMRSIVAGDDLQQIFGEEQRPKTPVVRTKSEEPTKKVDEATHKRYLDGRRKKEERELVKSTSDFIFKNSAEKNSDKNVLAAISNLDKARSQERANQKRQVGSKVCTKPLDLEYKDVEFNIGVEEFKEIDKKHEENKKQAADESILKKKQHLMKLRSLKSNKFYVEDEGAGKSGLTKEEAAEVKEIYRGIYRGLEPKMDLTQEKHWEFLESSESELEEAAEDDLKQNVLMDSQSPSDSEQDGENDTVEAMNLPNEVLKQFVKDVSAGKYKKSKYYKDMMKDDLTLKSRTESVRSENDISVSDFQRKTSRNESMVQDFQRKVSRFPSQISMKENDYQSRSPRKVRIDESFGDLIRRTKVEIEKKVEEVFPKKRTFIVKTESSPNLSLPLQNNIERKDMKGTVRVAPISKPKEPENELDELSPIGKIQNVQLNVGWDTSALLVDEDKGRKGLYEQKDDLSLLKSLIKTPGVDKVRLINLQSIHEDMNTPLQAEQSAKTITTDHITEIRSSVKGPETTRKDMNSSVITGYRTTHNPDAISEIIQEKPANPQKEAMIRAEEHLRQIVGPQSRIRVLKTTRGGVTSRSQISLMKNTEMSMGESKPNGPGFDDEVGSSPKTSGRANWAEMCSSNGDMESCRLQRQAMAKKRVERLREKQREVFKLSNKLFSRQATESMRKSSLDLSGTSRFSREKTTRPNSQSNSFHYGTSHYRCTSNEKQISDGYIALKDLYPQTVSHVHGINNSSSIQFKPANVSVHTDQTSQPKQDTKNTSRLKEDLSGLENSRDYVKSAGVSEMNDSKSPISTPGIIRKRKNKSWNRESMKIIIKNPTEVPETNPSTQIKRLLVEDLLPEAKDGMSERHRMKILIHRGEKYDNLEETGKLLEQMDILLAEADKLSQRIQIKGGRRNRQVREVPDLRKYLGFADLAQLLRVKNKSEKLGLKDTKELREFISLAYDDGQKIETLSAERLRDFAKELKQKLLKGDSWEIDCASYQLDKLDKCSEFRENLRITKETSKIRGIPGYLDKIEREEILRVQNDAIMAAHTVRMQKYCGETYMRKYYKNGVKALEDIKSNNLHVKSVNYSQRGKEVQERVSSTIGNDQKRDNSGEKREKYLNEEEKVKIYAENFKQNLTKRKELKDRVEKYIKEGRKNIDDFLEKERQEIEILHDKKALSKEIVKMAWENKI